MAGHRKWSDIRGDIESRPGYAERAAKLRAETLEEIQLFELRRTEEISQVELAERLNITQAASRSSRTPTTSVFRPCAGTSKHSAPGLNSSPSSTTQTAASPTTWARTLRNATLGLPYWSQHKKFGIASVTRQQIAGYRCSSSSCDRRPRIESMASAEAAASRNRAHAGRFCTSCKRPCGFGVDEATSSQRFNGSVPMLCGSLPAEVWSFGSVPGIGSGHRGQRAHVDSRLGVRFLAQLSPDRLVVCIERHRIDPQHSAHRNSPLSTNVTARKPAHREAVCTIPSVELCEWSTRYSVVVATISLIQSTASASGRTSRLPRPSRRSPPNPGKAGPWVVRAQRSGQQNDGARHSGARVDREGRSR
jgi:hypothetical protein